MGKEISTEIETPGLSDELWAELNDFCEKPTGGVLTKCRPDEIVKTVVAYATLGGSRKACAATGVPAATIRGWKQRQAWWPKIIAEVYAMQNEEHLSDLNSIIIKAGKELNDRVDNGDYVYDKEGKLITDTDEDGKEVPRRKKLSTHALAVDCLAIPTDKRALITGAKATTQETSSLAHLENIMRMCIDVGKEKDITEQSRIIDADS